MKVDLKIVNFKNVQKIGLMKHPVTRLICKVRLKDPSHIEGTQNENLRHKKYN